MLENLMKSGNLMVEAGFIFNFPRFDIKGETLMADQVEKITEEVKEVSIADMDGDAFMTAMELMDVIHAAETALRMLCVEQSTLDAARFAVERKNAERGYYESGR